jgi:uncharacterized DUF497 family protein
VKIEFDPDKSAKNVEKHGLHLGRFAGLDLDAGIIELDRRRPYGEDRYVVTAPLEKRLHVGCFCIRDGAFRIISLRSANDREVRRYERAQAEKAAKTATSPAAIDR